MPSAKGSKYRTPAPSLWATVKTENICGDGGEGEWDCLDIPPFPLRFKEINEP